MLGHKLIPNASLLDETLHFRQDIWFVYLQHLVTDSLAGNRNAASPDWTSFPSPVQIFPVCASTFFPNTANDPNCTHRTGISNLYMTTKIYVSFVLHVLTPTLFWDSATVTRCPETRSWSQRPMPCVAWANFLSSSDWEHTAELLRGSMQLLDW